MNLCIVIPVYNHHHALKQVVAQLKPFNLPCVLVNDGSSAECTQALKIIQHQESHWISLLHRKPNGGKGAAVTAGLKWAIDHGYSHALQIDADGQHCTRDIPAFLEASHNHPDALILGQPVFGPEVPKKRLYGRQFTNLWIWINTLSFKIKDGMCGFRIYPLAAVKILLVKTSLGQRMDFDIEIVVRLYWQGTDILNIPTRVQYPLDGISHFKMLKDNLLISKKHAQLFFGMLWRLPFLIIRHFKRA